MRFTILALVSLTVLFSGCTEHVTKEQDRAARKATINAVTVQMKKELAEWHFAGIDDGSGLLYQSTPSYQKLLDLCSKDELIAIHKETSPAVPFYDVEKTK